MGQSDNAGHPGNRGRSSGTPSPTHPSSAGVLLLLLLPLPLLPGSLLAASHCTARVRLSSPSSWASTAASWP